MNKELLKQLIEASPLKEVLLLLEAIKQENQIISEKGFWIGMTKAELKRILEAQEGKELPLLELKLLLRKLNMPKGYECWINDYWISHAHKRTLEKGSRTWETYWNEYGKR